MRIGVHATKRAYHHGNLAEALVDEATVLARAGGPEAVVLREAARRVGVSAAAAYRHFDGQEALQLAVKYRAMESLAQRLAAAADDLPPTTDPAIQAIRRVVAIGRAYFGFAMQEKGLFRCFCLGLPLPPELALGPDQLAFGVLSTVIDDLVTVGVMPAERRPGIEIGAWAAVHGLAVLALDGVLETHPGIDLDTMLEATLATVLRGLLGPDVESGGALAMSVSGQRSIG